MSVNSITQNGCTIQQLADVLNELINGATIGTTTYPGFLSIFPNANIDPNSPDGQMLNIFAIAKMNVLEVSLQIYNAFDPDQASGVVLDQRCAINGVVRNPGSSTSVQVVLTYAGASVTLQGLDEFLPSQCFGVVDAQNNLYSLETTTNLNGTGSVTLIFQSALPGSFNPLPNTITQVAVFRPGVTSVNNPYPALVVGVAQESDAALRVRRQNSVAIPSGAFLEGLLAQLLALNGVSQAQVYENDTNATVYTVNGGIPTDSAGLAGHSMWAIVSPNSPTALSVLPPSIAATLLNTKNIGAGLKGAQTFVIPGGTLLSQAGNPIPTAPFTAAWDWSLYANLWVEMTITALNDSPTFDAGAIAQSILRQFGQGPLGGVFINDVGTYQNPPTIYNIGGQADSSAISAWVKENYPGVSVTACQIAVSTQVQVSIITTAPNIALDGMDANTLADVFKVSDGTHVYVLAQSLITGPSGGGSGATATATESGGAINALTITAPGSDYGADSVTITINDPTGTGAVVTPILTSGALTGYTIVDAGSGYTAPTVVVSAPGPYVLTFFAETPTTLAQGANTLTTIVTPVTGVATVNNPAAQSFEGSPYDEGLLSPSTAQYQFALYPTQIVINGSPAL